MRLLDLFERGRPEMPLSEFVRRSGYSKSTTYRLLLTLEEAGWLERGPGGTFRLTIRPRQVGSILVDCLELRREAGRTRSADVQAGVRFHPLLSFVDHSEGPASENLLT